MNKVLRRQPAILETWYIYFAMQQGAFNYLLMMLEVWARYMTRRFPAKATESL